MRCHTFAVKVAVSLPDDLFARADALAEEMALNRSQLYAQALAQFLDGHDTDPVTAALDKIADGLPHADPRAGRELIESGAWEW